MGGLIGALHGVGGWDEDSELKSICPPSLHSSVVVGCQSSVVGRRSVAWSLDSFPACLHKRILQCSFLLAWLSPFTVEQRWRFRVIFLAYGISKTNADWLDSLEKYD